jgi:hypothetical protein
MNPQSIDAITPLIADLKVQGRSVNIIFQCPVTGKQYKAKQYQQQDRSIGGQAMKSAKRSAMYAIQTVLSEVIRNIFGHNTVGRAAGNVARQTMYSASSTVQNSLSSKEKDQAILAAFQTVAKNFTWEQSSARWISSQGIQETLSPFEQQQRQFPVQHPYDLQVLSRMLVEVAMSDGTIAKEESDWLTNMLNPVNGSLESLTQRPALSGAETQPSYSGKRQGNTTDANLGTRSL